MRSFFAADILGVELDECLEELRFSVEVPTLRYRRVGFFREVLRLELVAGSFMMRRRLVRFVVGGVAVGAVGRTVGGSHDETQESPAMSLGGLHDSVFRATGTDLNALKRVCGGKRWLEV